MLRIDVAARLPQAPTTGARESTAAPEARQVGQVRAIHLAELLAEVLVQVAVENGIAAGRGAADEMANGEHYPKLMIVALENVREVADEIEQIQWQPAENEDERNADQHCMGSFDQIQLALLLALELGETLASNETLL